jgi:hypothetical protein
VLEHLDGHEVGEALGRTLRTEVAHPQPIGHVRAAPHELGDRFLREIDAVERGAGVYQGQVIPAVAAADVQAAATP